MLSRGSKQLIRPYNIIAGHVGSHSKTVWLNIIDISANRSIDISVCFSVRKSKDVRKEF